MSSALLAVPERSDNSSTLSIPAGHRHLKMRSGSYISPSRASSRLPKMLEHEWTHNELLPFLISAYGERHDEFWMDGVCRAADMIHDLAIYEDFESTVERIRLLLISPHILTDAEMKDFGALREDENLCIAVFIRHFINHGPYKLSSLGCEPHPDHPRPQTSVENGETYIYGGKLSRRRFEKNPRNARKATWTKDCERKTSKTPGESSMGRNMGRPATNGKMPHVQTAPWLKSKSKAFGVSGANHHRSESMRQPDKDHAPARPSATPARNGPGVPVRGQPPMKTHDMPQHVNAPMHMQGPPQSESYSVPSYRYHTRNRSTLAPNDDLYETSWRYNQASAVGNPSDRKTYQQQHYDDLGHVASLAPTSTKENSGPGMPIADPAVQLRDSFRHMRLDASDFVPGVREHNF